MRRFIYATLLSASSALLAAAPECERCAPPEKPIFLQKGCSKWYAGLGVSFADLFYYSNRESNDIPSTFFSDNDQESENTDSAPSLGYNAFLGFSYNDYIDIEMKVVQILKPFKNNFHADVSNAVTDDTFFGTTKLYFLSFGPYVLINLPLSKAFTPFFRFGMVTDLITIKRSTEEDTAFDTDLLLTQGSQKEYFWAEKFNIGFGFKFSWKDTFSLRAEYETPTSTLIPGTTTGLGRDFYIPGVLSASLLLQF